MSLHKLFHVQNQKFFFPSLSPKFSPPQMSMWVSYWPRWLNQLLSMTKMPPAMTGVLQMQTDVLTPRKKLPSSHTEGAETDLMGRVGSLLAIFCSIGICSHLKWRLQSKPAVKKTLWPTKTSRGSHHDLQTVSRSHFFWDLDPFPSFPSNPEDVHSQPVSLTSS